MKPAKWMASVAVGALAFVGASAWADPPQRVGRLSFVQGDVSVQPPDRNDWMPASRNFPVTRDEAFWTQPGALAELQIGLVDAFMDSSTELQVDELDYGVLQFSLPEGVIHVELSRVPDGGVRIETPQGEVRLVRSGSYRIDAGVPENGVRDTVIVTTLNGLAEIAGPNTLVQVRANESAEIDNGYQVAMGRGFAEGIDDFARRQLAEERYGVTTQYVSDEYTGYEDLGAYGDWEQTAEYGAVWYPRSIAADWAPYRDGHWDYVEPWGWTWIDDAPWGFTPFHYGRWTQIRGRWCWVPGESARRPVYAPALVSFIGDPGFGVGVNVGWVPLAPQEIYQPYYTVSTTYVRNINIYNVNRTVVNRITFDNIRNVNYSHRNDHARTFVRQDDFRRASPVQRSFIRDNRPDAGRKFEHVSIDRIRPNDSDRGGRQGHAPRNDDHRVALRPPSANVVPNTPTQPRGTFSGRRDNNDRGADRGGNRQQQATGVQPGGRFERNDQRNANNDNRGNRFNGGPQQTGDTRRLDNGDHRQPPIPPGRDANSDGRRDNGRGASDERRARFSGTPQNNGQPGVIQQQPGSNEDRRSRGEGFTRGPQTNGQPAVQQPAANTDRGARPGRDFNPGGQQQANERQGNRGRSRFGEAPQQQPQVQIPQQQPQEQAVVRPDRGDRRGDRWPGNPNIQQQPQPQVQPEEQRGGRGDRGNRFNQPQAQPQPAQQNDNQARWRREEPRQPVVANAPQPQQERQDRGQDNGRGRQRQEQPQQPQAAQQPANGDQNNGRSGGDGDRQRGRHGRN